MIYQNEMIFFQELPLGTGLIFHEKIPRDLFFKISDLHENKKVKRKKKSLNGHLFSEKFLDMVPIFGKTQTNPNLSNPPPFELQMGI